MSLYGYQPLRALQILDSAVIVGNVSEWRSDMIRAKIYSSSLMKEQIDSLLGGREDIRLDSAQAIGERVLRHDSVKANLKRQLDLLEILSHTARMKNDTTGWLQRSREFVDICYRLGDEQETNALRTEAEIGAALCSMGQMEQGMAKLDSALFAISNKTSFRFNELDALIIALKRKITILGSHDNYAETIPLARCILEYLDKYEENPDDFHDGTYREPKSDQKRADYIQFYRRQALNNITSAYASLREYDNMRVAFEKIERGVRDVVAREHIARYNALQQQIESERQQNKANRANMRAIAIGIFALLAIVFALVVIFKNRAISRMNRLLAQQVADAVNYKKMFWEEKRAQVPKIANSDLNTLTDEQLFLYINDVILRDKLFLIPDFGRQAIMDRFQLSKERVGAIFSKGSKHSNASNYIQQLRLDYATHQLVEQPDKSIVQIALECGFSSNSYFSDRFRLRFGISPSDFRNEALGHSGASPVL